jgi:hypothetical protein
MLYKFKKIRLIMQITMAPESLMPGFKRSWNKDRHQSLAYTLARS